MAGARSLETAIRPVGSPSERTGGDVSVQQTRARPDERPSVPGNDGVVRCADVPMRRLFQTYYAAIWRLLRRLGIPSAGVDDAAQEVFWIAARKLTEIRPGREHAFLYGVAIRVASHEHRRRRTAPSSAAVEELARLHDLRPSPEEHLAQRQARALLDVVLDQMAIELRTLFVLCDLEEIEVQAAAALEGIPVGTASSRLRRAREEFSTIAARVRAGLIARGGLR
jgi:RNA polymerase sigma-70 factor, ECF subfamily